MKTKTLVIAGLLIAIDVLCARLLYFYTPGNLDRLSLQFLPNAVAGLLFGPVWGFVVCALGDIVGMFVNPAGMSFMPLITLAAGMRGLLYGLLLHNRRVSLWRCIAAVAAVTAVVELGLMPVFLSILYGKGYLAVLLGKLPVRLITIPTYGAVLFGVLRALSRAKIEGIRGLEDGK